MSGSAGAYRIGVHLAMTQNVTAALGVIAGQMMGLQRHINGARVGFNSLGTAIAGLGAVFAGAGILAGMGSLLKAGEGLVHQQTLLKMAGESSASVAQGTAAAWAASFQVQGTTVTQNMKTLGDLRSLLGSMPEAQQLLPKFAQLQRIIGVVTGQDDAKAGDFIARFLDARGALRFDSAGKVDAGRFEAEMSALQAATINNRGRVSPQQMFNFQQRARAAGAVLSPEAMYADMSVLIETMGGHVAGTALQAANRQFTRGIMPVRQADQLRAAGLITGSYKPVEPKDRARVANEIYRNEGIKINPAQQVVLGERSMKGGELLRSGQWVKYFTDVMKPAMNAWMQRTEGRDANMEDQQKLIAQWVSTGPAQGFFSQIATSLQQIERERAMQKDIRENPQRAINDMNRDDPVAARTRLAASFENLKIAAGIGGVPLAIAAMNLLSSAIDRFSKTLVAHPAATKYLLGIAAGLGVSLVVIGSLAILAAAITAIGGGAAAAVLIGIGIAFGALAVALTQVNWDRMIADIRSSFAQMSASFTQMYAAVRNAIVVGLTYASEVYTRARDGIRSTFGQLRDYVVATVTGWGTSFSAAVDRFRASAASVIEAVIAWLVGIPGRVLQSLGLASPAAPPAPLTAPSTATPGAPGAPGAATPGPGASLSPSAFVPASAGGETIIHNITTLDGRVIAENTTRHQSRAANGPAQSIGLFDPRRPGVRGETVGA